MYSPKFKSLAKKADKALKLIKESRNAFNYDLATFEFSEDAALVHAIVVKIKITIVITMIFINFFMTKVGDDSDQVGDEINGANEEKNKVGFDY